MGKDAEICRQQGYKAFGSLLPGRNYSSDSYNFGFQGQIKDDEVYGATGTSYAYKYRMQDTRVGRFWSIDPLAAKYPHNSPYAFSENRVIDMVEFEGLEATRPPADQLQPQQPNGNGTIKEGGDGMYLGAAYSLNPSAGGISSKVPSAATSLRLQPTHGESKFVSGPSVSASVPPSVALPYTAPSLTQSQEKSDFATDLFGLASSMMAGAKKALNISAANTELRYAVRTATGGILNAAEATTAANIGLESAADIAGHIGTAFGGFGLLATAIGSLSDGNLTAGDGVKTLVGMGELFCPLCGAADLGIELFTGKSGAAWLGEGADYLTHGKGYHFNW